MVLFFIGNLFSQVEQINLTPEEKAWIKANPVIPFGYDPGWKPIEFIDKDGKHAGITADFLALLEKKTSLKFKQYPDIKEWSESEVLLRYKKILLLPALAQNEHRNKFMDFTDAFFSYSFVIITQKDGEFIGGLEDLDGKNVAVPKSYYITGLLEQEQIDMNLIYKSSIEDCLMAVATGEAVATVTNLTVASHYMNYSGYDNLKIAAPTPYPEIDIKMGVAKDQPELLSILQKGIRAFTPRERNEIVNNWVSVQFEHGVDMAKVWRIAGISIGIVLAIFGTFFYWNRKLKKEVSRRKEAEEQLKLSFDEISEQKKIIEHKNEEVLDSIKYAKRLQEAILPPKENIDNSLEKNFVLYQPKDIVAGDFYWMEKVRTANDKDKVFIAAADCTGHGVPGAMVSVVCSNALNQSVLAYNCHSPNLILDKTRDLVIERFERSKEDVRDGMDIGLVSIEKSDGNKFQIEFSGAHNNLFVVTNREELKHSSKPIFHEASQNYLHEVKANKQPVGKFEFHQPFKNYTLELEQGDRIYLSSDGYPDQFGGANGKKLKSKNFKQKILDSCTRSMEEQKTYLASFFDEWMGDYEQLDDVCVIGIELS
ncbi:MAG: transporter substrate-binding domain-containing protein [Crocinitomicaceae bacterium]|nr:transporter substrate-binding domain-containing protein [Crocinitomicaceae bacterium]